MNEQYEPSYYEIALTGRQVLVAFVILLVCLVAAFFSGVWVGRGEVGGEPVVAERSVDPPAESESTADVEEAGPRPEPEREELSFFEEGSPEAAAEGEGEPPVEGATGSEPAEPTPARERAEAADAEAEAEAGQDEPDPDPSRSRSEQEEVDPRRAPGTGDVVIQVFSSADEAKAQEMLERLHANDFRAFLSPVTDDGQTFHRVRVGPFEHPEDAERVAAELRRRLDLDTWITR